MKIEHFIKYGIKVTWKLLEIGYKSDSVFSNQLTSADIISYAIGKLAECDDIVIIDLASEYESNTDSIQDKLYTLAEMENSSYELEFKKWQVVYVLTNLPQENIDYLQGLFKLGDIWADLNYPLDSPHIYQGRHNEISPEEYYTQQNYRLLWQKHCEWIANELKQIEDDSKDEEYDFP